MFGGSVLIGSALRVGRRLWLGQIVRLLRGIPGYIGPSIGGPQSIQVFLIYGTIAV